MGHAPGHLREAFQIWLYDWSHRPYGEEHDLDRTVEIGRHKTPLRRLLGRLWNCSDTLPGEYCEMADVRKGSTYAQAVRSLKPSLAKTPTT